MGTRTGFAKHGKMSCDRVGWGYSRNATAIAFG